MSRIAFPLNRLDERADKGKGTDQGTDHAQDFGRAESLQNRFPETALFGFDGDPQAGIIVGMRKIKCLLPLGGQRQGRDHRVQGAIGDPIEETLEGSLRIPIRQLDLIEDRFP